MIIMNRIEWNKWLIVHFGITFQKRVEHGFPGKAVNFRRTGDHSVKIKNCTFKYVAHYRTLKFIGL